MAGASDSDLGGRSVVRKSASEIAKRSNLPVRGKAGPRVINIEGRVIRKPSNEVAKRAGSEVAKKSGDAASKVGKLAKVGRFAKGAGPVGLAAAATYELGKSAVDHRNKMLKAGYIQSVEKNAPNEWTPTGVHSKYVKPAQRRSEAASKMSERNYSTYGGKEQNAPRLKVAKKEWAKNKEKALKNVGSGSHDLGKDLTEANQKAMYNYRLNRRLRGDFKGKYYGPDEFKGNEKKLSAWRAAGSPKDKKRFA